MTEQDKKLRKLIFGISLGILIAAMAVLIWGAVTRKISTGLYNVLISAAMLIFWILMDVVEPMATHRLTEISPERKSAYYKYIFLDLAGYAGLIFFLYSAGSGGSASKGIYGAVVYALVMGPRRKQQKIFQGEVDANGQPFEKNSVEAQENKPEELPEHTEDASDKEE